MSVDQPFIIDRADAVDDLFLELVNALKQQFLDGLKDLDFLAASVWKLDNVQLPLHKQCKTYNPPTNKKHPNKP